MKIPKDDAVKFVIRASLAKKKANSQSELTLMINNELRKVDSDYSISGKRLRMIAVKMHEVKVKVEIKKGRMPKKCPSCGSMLKKTYNRNLKGKKVLEYLKCQKCGYKGHDGKWKPRKYAFILKKSFN